MNTTVVAISPPSATSRTGRRPTSSDTRPARIREVSTPNAYVAYTSVSTSGENPHSSRYVPYSGDGVIEANSARPTTDATSAYASAGESVRRIVSGGGASVTDIGSFDISNDLEASKL